MFLTGTLGPSWSAVFDAFPEHGSRPYNAMYRPARFSYLKPQTTTAMTAIEATVGTSTSARAWPGERSASRCEHYSERFGVP